MAFRLKGMSGGEPRILRPVRNGEKPRIRGMQGFVELPGFEPGIILLTISTLCGVSYFGPTIRPFVSKYDVP